MLTNLQKLKTKLVGKPLRSIKTLDSIFLTFDDGPDPDLTPKILDLLKRHEAKATFFVIAKKAKKSPDLMRRILNEGHSIGNHSLDHQYKVFFQGRASMKEWIMQSEKTLGEMGIESVGFRPPVGIRTPELSLTLKEAGLPLILWKQRCFDSVFPFTPPKAIKLAKRLRPGEIILLHDMQPLKRHSIFLDALNQFIISIKNKNLKLDPIPKSPSTH